MKSNQKLSIMFWMFKAKASKKDGRAPLYARITIGGDSNEISLSKKVLPMYWDPDSKCVSKEAPFSKAINQQIAHTEMALENHMLVLRTQYEVITPQMLKNVYQGYPAYHDMDEQIIEEKKSKTLLDAFLDFITKFDKQVQKKRKSDGTLRHWKTTKGKVAAFLKFQYNLDDIGLIDIKYSFAEKFYDYCTLEVDEPLSEVTAKGHIKKIKQILKGCVANDFIPKNPIQEYSCAGGENDVEPLEMEQVWRIYNKEFSIQRLIEVRDVFIFQCFTGFAYQDVYALSADNIVKVGNKGERWLIKDRGKTGVSEMVPILPIVEEIIKKYKCHPYCLANNVLLPVNSNERYNGYLKEIAVICEIFIAANERGLGTHKARHTFADMMLNNGVPLEDVSKMLGHKSIRTTQRYCKVRKPRISESMAKVRNILFTKQGVLKKVS